MSNLQLVQDSSTQCIELDLKNQLVASRSSSSTQMVPQKRSNTINLRSQSSISTSPSSIPTAAAQASKKIKTTADRTTEKEKTTQWGANTDETVFTPWYVLASDPLVSFETHTSVAYSMIDENPLPLPKGDYEHDDSSTDDDDPEDEEETKRMNAKIK